MTRGALFLRAAMAKHFLAAKSSPVTAKALLVGNTSKPGLSRDPQEMCSNVSGSKHC